MARSDPATVDRKPAALARQFPTGAKLFLILSAALLPLALIAMIATLQTTRVADEEAAARLHVAADESARATAIELTGDMAALRTAAGALATDPTDSPSCARAQGVFAPQADSGATFAITDLRGHLLCGTVLPGRLRSVGGDPAAIRGRLIAGQGLLLSIDGPARHTIASALFSRDLLSRIATPSGHAGYGVSLEREGERLELLPGAGTGPLDRVLSRKVDLGFGELFLVATVPSLPITSSLIVALLLPLVMWAAAAGIGWFVVDRLLIRPLRQLRSSVAAFAPGAVIDAGSTRTLPAQEIRDLGETFQAISRTVALHEAGLAEGLVRQTKLTREVHHRVKNNLQVISSLINFHARGALSPDATAAYASIQRRVDALAVVHRNHFAEMEENRGLNLRAAISELAANLRATAPERSAQVGLTLDCEPFLATQDVAVAVAFLMTELIELAIGVDPAAQVRVSLRAVEGDPARARLRIVSRALVDGDAHAELVETRYGRVLTGLSRQLRSALHHDPLTGAYEIVVAVLGRD